MSILIYSKNQFETRRTFHMHGATEEKCPCAIFQQRGGGGGGGVGAGWVVGKWARSESATWPFFIDDKINSSHFLSGAMLTRAFVPHMT